jgi:hypothetical protein
MINTIIMKPLRSKAHEKIMKHIKTMRKCNQFYRDGLSEAAVCVRKTSSISSGNAGAQLH